MTSLDSDGASNAARGRVPSLARYRRLGRRSGLRERRTGYAGGEGFGYNHGKQSHAGGGEGMTEGVRQKLQQELNNLDEELHVHLPREIKRAKEFGDLRENAEYHAALARQQYVQARMRQLRQRLSELASIDLSKIPHDRAAYGSTLVLYDAEREEEVTYRLVTPEESDPAAGLISTTSPVGRSLMGREEGDEVKVTTPAGTRNFEIKKLTTMHDEAKENAGDGD